MIKHLVIWQLKEHAHGQSAQQNAIQIKNMLESLRGKCTGLLKIEVGINCIEGLNNADLALYCEFEDQAALDFYQHYPEHVAMKAFIGAARQQRMAVDYKI